MYIGSWIPSFALLVVVGGIVGAAAFMIMRRRHVRQDNEPDGDGNDNNMEFDLELMENGRLDGHDDDDSECTYEDLVEESLD